METLRKILPTARERAAKHGRDIYVDFTITPFTETPAPPGFSTVIGAVRQASQLFARVSAHYGGQYGELEETTYKEWPAQEGVRRDDRIVTRTPYTEAFIRTPDVKAMMIGETSTLDLGEEGPDVPYAQVYERVYKPQVPHGTPTVEIRLTRVSKLPPAAPAGRGRGGPTHGGPVTTHGFVLRVVNPREEDDLTNSTSAWSHLLDFIRVIYSGTPYLYNKSAYDRIVTSIGGAISRDAERLLNAGSYLTVNHLIESPALIARAAVAKIPVGGNDGGGDGQVAAGFHILYVAPAGKPGEREVPPTGGTSGREVWLYTKRPGTTSPSLSYLGVDPSVGTGKSGGGVSLFIVSLSSSAYTQNVLHIIDALAVNGDDVRSKPHHQRMNAANAYLAARPLPTIIDRPDGAVAAYELHVAAYKPLRMKQSEVASDVAGEVVGLAGGEEAVNHFYEVIGSLLPMKPREQLIFIRQGISWPEASSGPLVWRQPEDITTLLSVNLPRKQRGEIALDANGDPIEYVPLMPERGTIVTREELDYAVLSSRDVRTKAMTYYGPPLEDDSVPLDGGAGVVEALYRPKQDAFTVTAQRPDRAYADPTFTVDKVMDATFWRVKQRTLRGEGNDLLVDTLAYSRLKIVERAVRVTPDRIIVVGPVERDVLDTLAAPRTPIDPTIRDAAGDSATQLTKTIFILSEDDTRSLGHIRKVSATQGPSFVQYVSILDPIVDVASTGIGDDVLLLSTPWLVITLPSILAGDISLSTIGRIRGEYLGLITEDIPTHSPVGLVFYSLPSYLPEVLGPLLNLRSGARTTYADNPNRGRVIRTMVWALVPDVGMFERYYNANLAASVNDYEYTIQTPTPSPSPQVTRTQPSPSPVTGGLFDSATSSESSSASQPPLDVANITKAPTTTAKDITSLDQLPGVEYDPTRGVTIKMGGVTMDASMSLEQAFASPGATVPISYMTLLTGKVRRLGDAIVTYGLPDGATDGFILYNPYAGQVISIRRRHDIGDYIHVRSPYYVGPLMDAKGNPVSADRWEEYKAMGYTVEPEEDEEATPKPIRTTARPRGGKEPQKAKYDTSISDKLTTALPPPNEDVTDWPWVTIKGTDYPYGGFYGALLDAFYPPYAQSSDASERALMVQSFINAVNVGDVAADDGEALDRLAEILQLNVVLFDSKAPYEVVQDTTVAGRPYVYMLITEDDDEEIDYDGEEGDQVESVATYQLLALATRAEDHHYQTLWPSAPKDSLAEVVRYDGHALAFNRTTLGRRKWATGATGGVVRLGEGVEVYPAPETDEELTNWDDPLIQGQLDRVIADGGQKAADGFIISGDTVDSLQGGLAESVPQAYEDGALILMASQWIPDSYLASVTYLLASLFTNVRVYTPLPKRNPLESVSTEGTALSPTPTFLLFTGSVPDVSKATIDNIVARFDVVSEPEEVDEDEEALQPISSLVPESILKADKQFTESWKVVA